MLRDKKTGMFFCLRDYKKLKKYGIFSVLRSKIKKIKKRSNSKIKYIS